MTNQAIYFLLNFSTPPNKSTSRSLLNSHWRRKANSLKSPLDPHHSFFFPSIDRFPVYDKKDRRARLVWMERFLHGMRSFRFLNPCRVPSRFESRVLVPFIETW